MVKVGDPAVRARALAEAGDYRTALEFARQALAESERKQGPDHPLTAERLDDLGRLCLSLGLLAEARQVLSRSLVIRGDSLGSLHPKVASAWHNLGMVLMAQGEYDEARTYLERGLAIRWRVMGPNHPNVAWSLKNLGLLMIERGDPLAARGLLDQALAIQQQSLGPEHLYVAETLYLFGELLASVGDLAGARSSLERALSIRSQTLRPDHPLVAETLTGLGRVLLREADYRSAGLHFERALALQERRLGSHHPTTAELRGLLGQVWMVGPKRAEARRLLARSYAELREALGDTHLHVSHALRILARFHWIGGEMDRARSLQHQAALAVQAKMLSMIEATSERERIAVTQARRVYLDEFLSLFDRPGDHGRVYAAVVRWKGVAARTQERQRMRALGGQDAELKDLVDELGRVRRELAGLAFSSPKAALEQAYRRARLQSLTREKETLQRKLSIASRQLESDLHFEEADLDGLCEALAPDQVLVDFMRYTRFTPAGVSSRGHSQERYLAFVLRGGACPDPVRVELGDAALIDWDVTLFRRLILGQASAERLGRLSRRLRERLWDPIERTLGARKQVWLIPDGALNSVPFAALADRDPGRHLIERFVFSHLPSARDFRKPAEAPGKKTHGALVVGGVDYGSSQGVGKGMRAGTVFGPVLGLPASMVEATEVGRLLEEGKQANHVTLLTGKAASERAVIEAAPGKRYLHLATHGFFESLSLKPQSLGPARGPNQALVGLLNPMLLSGLLLAGANQRSGRVGDLDGVLTAEEVAGVDLRGTELVTLSACDTGLGEVIDGEGVMGLRRAFAMAGVRSLVMSLWLVPDVETRMLMGAFYRRVVDDPNTPMAHALRAAQIDQLERQRQNQGHSDPRTWAAFIISGR